MPTEQLAAAGSGANAGPTSRPCRGAAVIGALWVDRSLTSLTFAIDYRLARLDPRMYHATSLALHLVAVGLMFLFTRRVLARAALGRRDGLALVVAAAFALHPIQTEAVSYVIQRGEVLASVFYLLTMIFLLDAKERSGLRGAVSYSVALAAFALGLGAKQIVVSVPLAFLLCCLCLPRRPGRHDGRRAWLRRILLAAPLLAASAAVTASNLASLRGSSSAGFDVRGLGPGRYLLTEWVELQAVHDPWGWTLPAGAAMLALGVALWIARGVIRARAKGPSPASPPTKGQAR